MTQRFSLKTTDPAAYAAMMALELYVKDIALDNKLKELIKIRVSQINKCAYCIEMHTDHAVKYGVPAAKLVTLPAWVESPHFSHEEKAALQFAEEVTGISAAAVADDTYNKLLQFYDEKAAAQLLMVIVLINSWNRIAITCKLEYKK